MKARISYYLTFDVEDNTLTKNEINDILSQEAIDNNLEEILNVIKNSINTIKINDINLKLEKVELNHPLFSGCIAVWDENSHPGYCCCGECMKKKK